MTHGGQKYLPLDEMRERLKTDDQLLIECVAVMGVARERGDSWQEQIRKLIAVFLVKCSGDMDDLVALRRGQERRDA